MIPLKEETADEVVQFVINPPLPRIYDSTGDTKTFHKFGALPRELQLRIFKNAMPASRVVRWAERVSRRNYWPAFDTSHPLFDQWKFPGLLSLLQACSVSNASVNVDGGFVKIQSERGRGRAPPLNWKWKHYTFMRPDQDIILLDCSDLVQLYQNGGSINLERFTHIAVYAESAEYKKWPQDLLLETLDVIQAHCPLLQRLSVFICNKWYRDFTHYENIRFLDIDDSLNLLKLNYRCYMMRTNQDEEFKIGSKLRKMLKSASHLHSQLQEVFMEMRQSREQRVVAYWKKVQVVPVTNCGSQNFYDDSDLYFSDLDAYVGRNDDGTLENTTWGWKGDEWHKCGTLVCAEPS
ncbi:uncharacterized protein EAE97_010377 [Botrytis byssoidea]|uniref:2EXR domain-containing protein n=1 Tax=Botrytis byssoidea TaxID=139641 RepID=A0A9P5I5K9_9HELO|nr:uncharacterized protein EAE97_010377 [Botrytis byssoidea]KAF7926077.1 hypothetical protein EAE97_010377 [Botrytis byssoidea]